ncbi:MAG: hypothetical protein FJX80_03510 [Bacteroidetes bacterium]|nr:hypothetical protein [Bacteroidota bacterium]
MIRNNLNRKENIRRATLFSKSISSYPTQLIRVSLDLIPSTCKIKQMTSSEINFLIEKVLELSSKIFGKKIKISVYSLLYWNNSTFEHSISLKFILVGRNLKTKIKIFEEKLSKLTDEVIGGDLTLTFYEENSPEDVFLEVFPVQFDENLTSIESFQFNTKYPYFYSRDLFRFLTSPMEMYHAKSSSF